jgi:hypothetical protein
MTASSTATIGSYELTSRAINEPPVTAARESLRSSGFIDESRRLGSHAGGDFSDGSGNGLESVTAQNAPVEVVESWKYPRENMFKTGAAFWSLLTSGANDAAYGVSHAESFVISVADLMITGFDPIRMCTQLLC